MPVWLGQLTNLQDLALSSNPLTALPPWLRQLTSFRELDLSSTLTALPAEIGQLTNLQFLFVEGNPLEEPWASLAAAGSRALLAHLRSLAASTRSGTTRVENQEPHKTSSGVLPTTPWT